MNIRLENKQDFYTVELLTRDAFWGEFEPGCVEHYLAHILRDAPCFIPELDFVGEQDGRVIANVIFSHGSIDSPDGQRHDAISFGPFSVASDWKGRGVGGALLRHALDQARAMGFGIVCLHGHADYYPRFGFRPAREYGVSDDYGVGDALTYIKNVYYPGQADKDIRADLPVAVVNANSMWLRVELGGSSVLFTGDIMKKKSDREDEPMDRMIAHYGAETLRSDIVKYPHHGISRNPAAKPVSQLLLKEGGVVVLTTKGAREKAGQMLAIYDAAFVTTEDGTQTFTMTAESVTQP